MSSLMDTWILVRDIESNGERNRGIYILKSRRYGALKSDPRIQANKYRSQFERCLSRVRRSVDRVRAHRTGSQGGD